MSSYSQHAMPIIILAMGCEMMYILHQRLGAQSVSADKASQVLKQVISALVEPALMDELFKPQDVYSVPSTKVIFEKIAHSSIMRLNSSSIDKLYDLMIMGFKYQSVACQVPQQYLSLTLNHLNSIKHFVPCEAALIARIDQCEGRLAETYSRLSCTQWIYLKQAIYSFFHSRRTKVSLFLQLNMQNNNGVFLLPDVDRLSLGFAPTGTVTVHERGRGSTTTSLVGALPYAQAEINSVLDPGSTVGCNLYSVDLLAIAIKEKRASMSSVTLAEALLRSMLTRGGNAPATSGVHSTYSPQASAPSKAPRITASSAKAELNLLADILGVGSKASSKDGHDDKGSGASFRINLFPEEKNNIDSDGGGGGGMIFIDIDTAAEAKTVQGYLLDLHLHDEAAAKGEDDDDLLALMDSVK